MHKTVVFDEKAAGYDVEFTDTLVGRTQRKIIHDYMENLLGERSGLNILELNCGTGEDISFLRSYGTVTGSDHSPLMLEVARKKNPEVDFKIIDLNGPLPTDEKYDLIFSNFGGFNCISKKRLGQLNNELAEILNPGGQLIIVFISNWSLMEFLYFFLRLNFKKAFRRINGNTKFRNISVSYYSKKELVKVFGSFMMAAQVGVSKYLTGEYMNKWAPRLGIRESKACSPNGIWGSDHILLNFIRK